MENADLLADMDKRLIKAESTIKVLLRALNTLDYNDNMPQEKEITEQAMGRLNFLAMKSVEERMAEIQFGEYEEQMSSLYLRQKTLLEDYPHLKVLKKTTQHPIYGDDK